VKATKKGRTEVAAMSGTESKRAGVNGIELGYTIFGAGEPLVLLHGGFGSVEMFGPNVELLAAGRQVIGVDLQSHGRSPAADRPMRFETMADDIAALIRTLGLERAAIMGFSLGGGVDPVQADRLVSGDARGDGCHGCGHRGVHEADPAVRELRAHRAERR
jgi:hypothetical protein